MSNDLPVNIEAEQATVASVLIGGALALERAQKHVDASDFAREEHQHLFLAAESLHSRNQPTDPVTLRTELTRMGVWPLFVVHGGETYIMRLVEMLPSAASVEAYAKEVKTKSVLREAIETCAHVSGLAYTEDADPGDVAQQFGFYADALGRRLTSGGAIGGEDESTEALSERALEEMLDPTGGLPYGIRELDFYASLKPRQMTLAVARTGNNKTGFGIQTGLHNAERGKGVLFASYEMSREDLMQRVIYQKARVDSRGRMDAEVKAKLRAAQKHIARLPLRIMDSTGTPSRLLSLCRRFRRSNPLDLLIVDYLQRVPADKAPNRSGGYIKENEMIASVSKALSDNTIALGIPSLVLAQLNREGAKVEDEPQLHHIGGSGGLENDADVVIILHPKERREPGKTQAFSLLVAKQRFGSTGKADTHFTPWLTKFEDPSEVLLD